MPEAFSMKSTLDSAQLTTSPAAMRLAFVSLNSLA